MADSNENEKRFMRLQRLLDYLKQETKELKRIAAAADRRMRKPTATINLIRRKRR